MKKTTPAAQPPANAPAAPPRRLFVWLLLLATLGVYFNSLWGQFVFDDEPVIAGVIKRPGLWPAREAWLTGRRPFTELTWNANLALLGPEPFSFHVGNLAIHAAAVLVLFALARRLLSRPNVREEFRRFANGLAFAIALLWAVHPLNTQAVTYIVQRYESLASLMILVALLLTARACEASNGESGPGRRAWPWFIAAWVAALAALTSKEVAAGIGVLTLLLDRAFYSDSFKSLFKKRGLFHAAVLLLPATYLLLGMHDVVTTNPKEAAAAGFHATPHTPIQYLFSQGGVILYYLRLALWPHPQSFDYFDWTPAKRLIDDLPAAAVVGAIVIATVVAVFKRPAIGFLGACFFVILGPSSSIVPVRDLLFEHRMYAPLIVVITLVVLGIWLLLARVPLRKGEPIHGAATVAVALLIAASLALGVRTLLRNIDYHDTLELLGKNTETRPRNPRPYRNIANILVERHDRPNYLYEAMAYLDKATQLTPDDIEGHLYFARLAIEVNRFDLAIDRYNRILAKDPKSASALWRRGNALVRTGQMEAGLADLNLSIELDPKIAEAYAARALVHLLNQHRPEAIADYQRAHDLSPDEVPFMLGLAQTLANGTPPDPVTDAQRAQAEAVCRLAAEKAPDNASVFGAWGQLLVESGRVDEGQARLEKAHQLKPEDPELQRRLAWTLAVNPRSGAADVARALKLATDANTATHASLPLMLDTAGAASARAGQFEQAAGYATMAIRVARQYGQTDLADAIAARLSLYQSRQAYLLR